MSQTAALYQLQTLDNQIDSTRKRLDEIANLLSQNEAVRSAQATLDEAEATYRHWQAKQTNLELERGQLKIEAETAEKRLYSGKITNPRELTDLQDKVAELKRRREALEEPLLEAMYGVEEGEETVQQLKNTLERVKAEQAATLEALTGEQAELSAHLSDLELQAEQTRANVQPNHLSSYGQLRKRPGGIAVAQLNRSECGVCGVQLTSQLAQQVRRGEVLFCPTCERILHAG